MSIVLITGGSGLIGTHLTKLLLIEGFAVRHLSRNAKPDAVVKTFDWDIEKGTVDPLALENVDHIIHLSGAGIADKRWTEKRMRVLYTSRLDTAALLHREMGKTGAWPKSFISASGINYYGAVSSEHIFTETDPSANDTIGNLTQAWEAAADAWAEQCRVVKLRTAVVLARESGALQKLAAPARWGLSAPLGSGKQWMPWVHIKDLTHAYLHAIRNEEMQGAYNVAAPEDVRNRDIMRTLAHVFHKPFFAPNVPGFAIRTVIGESAELILKGSRASSAKLVATGFDFKHPMLGAALRDLLQ